MFPDQVEDETVTTTTEPTEVSIRDQIESAFEESIKEPEVVGADEGVTEKAETPVVEQTEQAEPQTPTTPAPQSWTAEEKAVWDKLTPEAQAAIHRREKGIEKMFTDHNGELRIGREMKEVLAPYMPIFQQTGAHPTAFIKDVLGTVNALRTGDNAQKVAVIHEIARQYGVDLNNQAAPQTQEFVDPTIANMQRELQQLREMANPDVIEKRLQERMEIGNINAEVKAFAENPANLHFEKVRGMMGALMQSGNAANLQEAYDMACHAHPEVRSTIEAAKNAEIQKKRADTIAAKQNAAASVSGSPGVATPRSTGTPKTLEEQIAQAFDDVTSSKV